MVMDMWTADDDYVATTLIVVDCRWRRRRKWTLVSTDVCGNWQWLRGVCVCWAVAGRWADAAAAVVRTLAVAGDPGGVDDAAPPSPGLGVVGIGAAVTWLGRRFRSVVPGGGVVVVVGVRCTTAVAGVDVVCAWLGMVGGRMTGAVRWERGRPVRRPLCRRPLGGCLGALLWFPGRSVLGFRIRYLSLGCVDRDRVFPLSFLSRKGGWG